MKQRQLVYKRNNKDGDIMLQWSVLLSGIYTIVATAHDYKIKRTVLMIMNKVTVVGHNRTHVHTRNFHLPNQSSGLV